MEYRVKWWVDSLTDCFSKRNYCKNRQSTEREMIEREHAFSYVEDTIELVRNEIESLNGTREAKDYLLKQIILKALKRAQ